MDRRNFIKTSTACGLLIVSPKTAFGYAANSAVRYGLLGCGNRGTGVATSFAKNTAARIVALGDIFPAQLIHPLIDIINSLSTSPPINTWQKQLHSHQCSHTLLMPFSPPPSTL